MKCKHCGAQLHNDDELCYSCGAAVKNEKNGIDSETGTVTLHETVEDVVVDGNEKNGEEKAAAPISIWKVVAATAVCMLLLCVLSVVVINSITGSNWPFDQFAKETTAEPTTAETEPQISYTAEDLLLAGISEKAVYSSEDPQTVNAVVATMGDMALTNGQLQYLYWSQFYNFVNNYDYTQYGMDIGAPLSQQMFPNSDFTWEQYFLDSALKTWQQYAALNLAAKDAGYVLPEDVQADLDSLIDDYSKQAVENGFEDGVALLHAQMGPGIALEDMLAVETMYAIGDNYYTHLYNSQDPTREEVEAYFDENAVLFSSYYGITKESGLLVDVRHVLLQPEGCEFDDNNYVVATDEQWESCRAAAQELLDGWVKDGATEDGFAQLAIENSVDGSATDGGLYQYVATGTMVENFDAWLFEEGRKAGDYGLVRTEFGYHLMYYVGGDEAWFLYGRDSSDGYLNSVGRGVLSDYMEANELDVKFADILLGTAKLNVEDEVEETTDSTAATES